MIKIIKISILRVLWIILKNIPLINNLIFLILRNSRNFFWKFRGSKPVKLGPANKKFLDKLIFLIGEDKNFDLIEIGCAAGATLIQLSIKYPHSNFMGLDIRMGAIKDGNEFIKKRSIENLFLENKDLNKISDFQECDYLISRATLIYFSSEELKNFLEKIKYKVNKKIIFQEIHSNSSSIQKHYYFAHPYKKILDDLGFQDLFEISIEYMNFSPWKSKNWTGANIILRKR
tara:strand:- start:753 stop:1445 length:693 start_codon:yes stop_codon:yes gene_type:complete